jgi:hypothetical protein
MNTETNKLAADMVAQQISMYDQQLAHLQEQQRQIEARIEAVKMMRTALMPLLQSHKIEVPTGASTFSSDQPVVFGTQVSIFPSSVSSGDLLRPSGSTGFADAVRAALRVRSKGGTPSEVAEQMKTDGTDATYKGKTPFSVRVGNELHRLMKTGEVGRRSGRYYLIQQEQPQ